MNDEAQGIVEDEEVSEQDESLSETLEAAFTEAEGSDDAPSGDTDQSGAVSADAEHDTGGEARAGEADSGKDAGDAEPSASPAGGKPPVDWSPELREKWAGLPDDIKGKISERERNVAQVMQNTAAARRMEQDFTSLTSKYGSVIAAEGAQHPMQIVQPLLQTVAELRMGTSAQKATRIAELIQRYDVDIATLDDALSSSISGEPGETAQQSELERLLEQKMAPVNQMMQNLAGMQQQKHQVSQQEAVNEVNQFAQQAEFLNDVRHDVADLIDLATKQGRQMTLQEAYDKACAMNPQISQVMQQRAEATKLQQASQTVASKRQAASSLKPRGMGGQTGGNDSLYDSISAAWDSQVGR